AWPRSCDADPCSHNPIVASRALQNFLARINIKWRWCLALRQVTVVAPRSHKVVIVDCQEPLNLRRFISQLHELHYEAGGLLYAVDKAPPVCGFSVFLLVFFLRGRALVLLHSVSSGHLYSPSTLILCPHP